MITNRKRRSERLAAKAAEDGGVDVARNCTEDRFMALPQRIERTPRRRLDGSREDFAQGIQCSRSLWSNEMRRQGPETAVSTRPCRLVGERPAPATAAFSSQRPSQFVIFYRFTYRATSLRGCSFTGGAFHEIKSIVESHCYLFACNARRCAGLRRQWQRRKWNQ
jgi:hypothetical protein